MFPSAEVKPKPIDSHCHLFDDKFNSDRDAIITSSLENLSGMVIVIEDPTLFSTLPITEHTRIKYAVGFHPYYACEVNEASIRTLEETITNSKSITAVGEMGLDFFHCKIEKSVQIKAFTSQVELAIRMQLPIVVHCREAEHELLPILKEYRSSLVDVVLHCYGGNLDYLVPFLELGCYISFAGNVTFPKAKNLHTCAKQVPLSQLLIETDAPYLAPQPVRGKRCIPEYVYYTAEAIASLKNIDSEAIIHSTTTNAKKIFQIEGAE